MAFINWFDSLLPTFFEKIANPILDKIMVFLSQINDIGAIWYGVILTLICIKKYRKLGIAAFISLALCFLLGDYGIKPLIGRIRPSDLSNIFLMTRPEDFSFPSMHTATSFAVAFALFRSDKKMGIPFLIIAGLIALSRIYLGVHYTTDVIGGAVFGILIAYIITKILKKSKKL